MPNDAPDAPNTPAAPLDEAEARLGPPLKLSPGLLRWHLGSAMAIIPVALGVVFWPEAWPREGRAALHTVLMLLMSVSLYVQWRAGLLGLSPYQLYLRFRSPHRGFHRWFGHLHTVAGGLFLAAAITHSCSG